MITCENQHFPGRVGGGGGGVVGVWSCLPCEERRASALRRPSRVKRLCVRAENGRRSSKLPPRPWHKQTRATGPTLQSYFSRLKVGHRSTSTIRATMLSGPARARRWVSTRSTLRACTALSSSCVYSTSIRHTGRAWASPASSGGTVPRR
ncbi:uncharacterized protein MRET_3879 [Malassezia restricta]|uniref:uncharacterized protein n=1 Tax=Malassezia restricta TaxID=76775 RepID=UPI000DD16EA8|nr:uncharacterized protein MRET_3879 [Malassezia restricta]AXA51936.1 uncharacterized protein MRET_3879 [Malassezia restricta]